MRPAPWIALLALALAPRQEPPAEQDTELARHMKSVEDQVKALRRALREEGGRSSALETLAELERVSLLCKGLTPAMAAALPEGERAALLTAYRRTMVDFLALQLELESALLDGNDEAARAAFDRLRAMEDSAHERFAPEED